MCTTPALRYLILPDYCHYRLDSKKKGGFGRGLGNSGYEGSEWTDTEKRHRHWDLGLCRVGFE